MQNQNYLDGIYIRAVLPSDAAQLHFTFWAERSCFDIQSLIQRALKNEKCHRGIALVALEKQTSACVAFGQIVPWKNDIEISDLIVAPAWRRRKIGTTILQHLLDYAQNFRFLRIEIGAASTNTDALSLYKQLGFHEFRTVALENEDPIIYLRRSLKS